MIRTSKNRKILLEEHELFEILDKPPLVVERWCEDRTLCYYETPVGRLYPWTVVRNIFVWGEEPELCDRWPCTKIDNHAKITMQERGRIIVARRRYLQSRGET